MNPKYLGVRMDRESGKLFLAEVRYRQAPKRIKDITDDVLLAFCAELVAEDSSVQLVREVRFSDDTAIRITIDLLEHGVPIHNPTNVPNNLQPAGGIPA